MFSGGIERDLGMKWVNDVKSKRKFFSNNRRNNIKKQHVDTRLICHMKSRTYIINFVNELPPKLPNKLGSEKTRK